MRCHRFSLTMPAVKPDAIIQQPIANDREFDRSIVRAKQNTSARSIAIADALFDELDGVDGFARRMAEDLKLARNEDEHGHSDSTKHMQVRAQMYRLGVQLAETSDELVASHSPLHGLTDDELIATLRETCVELILNDDEVRRTALQAAAARDVNVAAALLGIVENDPYPESAQPTEEELVAAALEDEVDP